MAAVDRGMLWMVVPEKSARRFILDCPHATTEYRLPTQRPKDDSTDIPILVRLVDQHHIQVMNDLYGTGREECACEPVTARITGAKPRVVDPVGTADKIRELMN